MAGTDAGLLNSCNIHAVVLRGQVHDRAALDAMLAGVRERVKTWNEEQGAK